MYQLWNNFKTTLLMGGLMGLCLGVGYLIGGENALLPALLLGGVINMAAYFFSDKIALATVRARPVSRQEDPRLHEIVERLAKRANLPTPNVYASPAAAPNAFATGRNPRNGVVCVTAGLRKILTEEELSGVIAHELSHIKHRDILITTVAATIGGAITYLTYLGLFFGGDDDDGNPLMALAMMILAPLAAGMIQMAISRSREYEADRAGAEIAGSPQGLAKALHKLHATSRKVPLPVPDAQSSLFIVAPLTGRRAAKLFMTHPPVEERIRRLKAMDR